MIKWIVLPFWLLGGLVWGIGYGLYVWYTEWKKVYD